jgi:hypothetical protein
MEMAIDCRQKVSLLDKCAKVSGEFVDIEYRCLEKIQELRALCGGLAATIATGKVTL